MKLLALENDCSKAFYSSRSVAWVEAGIDMLAASTYPASRRIESGTLRTW